MMDPITSSDLAALSSSNQRRSTRLQATPAARRDSLASVGSTPADRSSGSTPAMQSSRSTPRERSARNTPQESADHEEEDVTPSKRTGLRRKREEPKAPPKDAMEEAMKPLTDEERRKWTGWVELESDPVQFNFILRECGVEDIKVQEVLGLDEDMMNLLPKPVYGLIFLFKYWDEEDEKAEDLPTCPNHVWFANQTIINACATIALLNIVMNVPKIDLGENLNAFKAETRRLKPAYRGQALGENEFIRNIHNSFARRMDILNADLALSNDFEKWKKAKNAEKKKAPARKSQAKAKKKKDEEEPGFHFIAYVPINGIVWRLDGMQRQPVNLGEAGKDWMAIARENISLRIAQYDDGLTFNLLALCRSPLRTIPEKLSENIHSISAVEKALSATLPDWRAFIEADESSAPLPNEPNETFDISKELITHTYVPDSVERKLNAAATDPMGLMDLRRDLLAEQKQLQAAYVQEAASVGQENEETERRRIDYTPIIYGSIKELAEKGVLKEIIRDLVDSGQMKQ